MEEKRQSRKSSQTFFSHSFSLPLYVGIFCVFLFFCVEMGPKIKAGRCSLALHKFYMCPYHFLLFSSSVSIVICFYLNEKNIFREVVGKNDTKTKRIPFPIKGVHNNFDLSRLGYHTQNIDNH